MRVLIVSNFPSLRGRPTAGAFIEERAEGLRAHVESVDVVSVRAVTFSHHVRSLLVEGALAQVGWGDVGRHVDSREFAGGLPLWQYLWARRGHPLSAVRSVARSLLKAMPSARWDAIAGHGAYAIPAAGVAREISSATGIPYFAVAHGSDINYANPSAVPYLRRVFAESAGAFYVSDALRRRAMAMGFPSDNAHVTPNGVDRTLFRPRVGRGNSRPQIAFVGNLIEVKGADRLPGIMASVWRELPLAELEVVGDGPLRTQLEQSFKGRAVRFRGSVSRADVAEAMASADVLVLPSRSEGWPCVVLESQATGTPVVATDVGGSREAVGDGGAVVDGSAFSHEAFAAEVGRQLANANRRTVRERTDGYDWLQLGARETDLLKRLSDAWHSRRGSRNAEETL